MLGSMIRYCGHGYDFDGLWMKLICIKGSLRTSTINTIDIDVWLDSVDKYKSRLETYYSKLKNIMQNFILL